MTEILHRDRTEIAADEADKADVDHHQQGEHHQRLRPAQRRGDLDHGCRYEGKDRGLRHAPRSETLDDTRVGDIGDGDARSEENTSELQSLMRNSYAVFCQKKKIKIINIHYELSTYQLY